MKTVYISLTSDKVYKTEKQALESGDDFTEAVYCNKCGCTTTTDCDCKEGK